jgi:hypothetical protein
VRYSSLVGTLYLCKRKTALRSCAIQLQRGVLGVAVATPLQRRRDRWTAIALRRVNRQHTSGGSDTSTGSVKSLRVLPTAQLAETTEGTHRHAVKLGIP